MKLRFGLVLLLIAMLASVLPASASAWTKGPPVLGPYVTGVATDGRPYIGVGWDPNGGRPTVVELQVPSIGWVDVEYKISGKDIQAGMKYLYLPVDFHGSVGWCLYGRYGQTSYLYHIF